MVGSERKRRRVGKESEKVLCFEREREKERNYERERARERER